MATGAKQYNKGGLLSEAELNMKKGTTNKTEDSADSLGAPV
jgi:hypothetical protein